jgi:hypothetical protein
MSVNEDLEQVFDATRGQKATVTEEVYLSQFLSMSDLYLLSINPSNKKQTPINGDTAIVTLRRKIS